MREITTHKVYGCNEALKVVAVDEPGSGGANHQYIVEISSPGLPTWRVDVPFQNGPIKEVGTNGVTHEALLAIVIDRLECFQRGPFACDENKMALDAIGVGLAYLKRRTIARLACGVEGTHEI